MAASDTGTRVVVGAAAMAMGLVLLSFAPVTTITCHRSVHGGPATCDVRSALLGLVTVERQQVGGALTATIASEQGNRKNRGAYQLVLSGGTGSVVPAGLRELTHEDMEALASALNAFFADRQPGELPLRHFNWKANLIGAVMELVGLGILVSAASRGRR